MTRSLYYVLRDGVPTPVENVYEWSQWFEATENRHVVKTTIGHVVVSTIFLGYDARFMGAGPPILWETMVFGGDADGDQLRYASEEEARRGHDATCWRVAELLVKGKPSTEENAP